MNRDAGAQMDQEKRVIGQSTNTIFAPVHPLMRRILTLKHWQLFLIMVVPLYWISGPLRFVINTPGVIIFSWWINAIGVYGQQRKKTNKLGARATGLFKLNCVLAPASYFLLVMAYEPLADGDWAEYVFLPIAVYFCFAVLYIVAFAAKTITTLEVEKESETRGGFLNFVMMIIPLFGIWIIQPKITALICSDDA